MIFIDAHDIHSAQMRERSNSHPTTPPPCVFQSLLKKDSKKNFKESSSLEDIIADKEGCIQKMLHEFKTLQNDNEYLNSRLKAYEEDLRLQELSLKAVDDLSLDEDDDHMSSKPWWLFGEHELKLTEQQLNGHTQQFQRFFDVFLGTYRETNVAVKKVNRNKNWERCTRKTFLREVEQLRLVSTCV